MSSETGTECEWHCAPHLGLFCSIECEQEGELVEPIPWELTESETPFSQKLKALTEAANRAVESLERVAQSMSGVAVRWRDPAPRREDPDLIPYLLN